MYLNYVKFCSSLSFLESNFIPVCSLYKNKLRSTFRNTTNMQVREKKAELEKLKNTFVRRASEFLWNYFASLVDFMINDKSYFSQVTV